MTAVKTNRRPTTNMQYSVFYTCKGERMCAESMCRRLGDARWLVRELRKEGRVGMEIWRYDRSDWSDYQELIESH